MASNNNNAANAANNANGQQRKRFACELCNKYFTAQSSLNVHVASKHEGKRFECGECHEGFTDPSNHKRHVANCKQQGPWYHCPWGSCPHSGVRALPDVILMTKEDMAKVEAGELNIGALQTTEPSEGYKTPEVPQQAPGQQAQAQVADEDLAVYNAGVLGQSGYQPAANVYFDDVRNEFNYSFAAQRLVEATDDMAAPQENPGHNGQDFNLGMYLQEFNMDNVGLQAQVNLGHSGQAFPFSPQHFYWG
ncbi:hypothetical protein LTR47_003197 [Exophiala xenobiotica]|nr:hypothetical protein LTR72_006216 [Exophiala xenobiotica]KAK5235723.1 hypothetical protein LTR47_003197 [Exophiala xenobiotica]KAK5250489.1 hypothetical protein LTS06_004742 [Exophiala xenobiotica]KAK5262192.1 hypothetical protein LTR40_000758 [Exophiala xenobiotica]KAK5294996.1 hypothetical protein LTR14_004165 [Exophiala xenobiotica]